MLKNKKLNGLKTHQIQTLILIELKSEALGNFYESGFDKKLFLKSINKLKSINEDIDFITDDYVSKYIEIHENIFVNIRKEFFRQFTK